MTTQRVGVADGTRNWAPLNANNLGPVRVLRENRAPHQCTHTAEFQDLEACG